MSGDGCSGFMSYFWRRFLHHPPPWEPECNAHDVVYEKGGPLYRRLVADFWMAVGVWRNLWRQGRCDFWFWSVVMFIAVRVGGVWFIPFPTVIPQSDGTWKWSWTSVRWGYQFPFPFYAEGQTWGDLLYPRIWLAMLVIVIWLT